MDLGLSPGTSHIKRMQEEGGGASKGDGEGVPREEGGSPAECRVPEAK